MLEREIAESELARKDWEELGEGEASPLTLRIPQLEEARALLNAAEADLEKAKLNLERTIISLPFDGLIKKRMLGLVNMLMQDQSWVSLFNRKSFDTPSIDRY